MKFDDIYKIIEESKQRVKRYYHVTPSKNLPSIFKQGLVPMLGDRSKQVEGEIEGVFLFSSISDAVDAIGNELGEEFDEDEELTLLMITIPIDDLDSFELIDDGFSWVSLDPIPVEYISIGKKNF